jgi:phosphoglycerate kinase
VEGLPALERWRDLAGKRVLVRVDFNTPVAKVDGRLEVADDFRLRAALPLLARLRDAGALVVAATHFGRPKGRVVPEYSVEPLRRRLAELAPGVELLENLRFNPGEEANDPAFGASLVEGVDYYVNEAFGASHRAHASIMVPPTLVPSAAGPNLACEVAEITGALERPARPFVAVVGGAKVADKLGVVRALLERADTVVVGGGMAYTFLAAAGHAVGASLLSAEHLEECARLLAGGRVLIPVDGRGLLAGQPFGREGGADAVIEFGADVPEGAVGLDIGPRTEAAFAAAVAGAATVLWNGPMGVFEDPRFAAGTEALARAVADCAGRTIVGGGDSVAALGRFGLGGGVDFVSTGGGATLELVEFGDLPGLRALRESPFA